MVSSAAPLATVRDTLVRRIIRALNAATTVLEQPGFVKSLKEPDFLAGAWT